MGKTMSEDNDGPVWPPLLDIETLPSLASPVLTGSVLVQTDVNVAVVASLRELEIAIVWARQRLETNPHPDVMLNIHSDLFSGAVHNAFEAIKQFRLRREIPEIVTKLPNELRAKSRTHDYGPRRRSS